MSRGRPELNAHPAALPPLDREEATSDQIGAQIGSIARRVERIAALEQDRGSTFDGLGLGLGRGLGPAGPGSTELPARRACAPRAAPPASTSTSASGLPVSDPVHQLSMNPGELELF